MSAAEKILARLERVTETRAGQWLACCPAHHDRNPSLSIGDKDGQVLVKCFSGCEPKDILAAIGLRFTDLYDEPLGHHCPPLKPRERRRRQHAEAALLTLDHEAAITQLCADDMTAGFALDEPTRRRLADSAERIREVRRIIHDGTR